MRIFYLFLILLFSTAFFGDAQLITGNYLQEIKTDILLPEETGKNVIKLFKTENSLIAVTSNGIYRFSNGKWTGTISDSNWKCAKADNIGNIWLATDKFIQKEGGNSQIVLPETAKKDSILCLFWEDEKTLLVGTTNGLLTFQNSWSEIPETKGKRINSIIADNNNNLWLATNEGLLQRNAGKWINLDDALMANGTKRKYFSLETSENKAEVYFGGLLTVGCITENGNNWMWSGADGLPYGPVTTIRKKKETFWFGTAQGAIKKDTVWHYYLGKRWLPDNKINDILVIDENTVWLATPKGICQIQQVEMSLSEKAEKFEKVIQERHIRRGLVNNSHLLIPGDLSSSKMVNEDNDGLWTSTYLAAECFRYAVTKNEDARENAVRTFEALERLETVTGISGLPARSYALATDSVEQSRSPHPKKWHPSPDGKWQWLDDISSDEIVGHMFGISVFYDLVADSTAKIRVRILVERIMNHIIDNNFHLIDYDGLPTRWGVWHPDSLNYSVNWAYEKGLYSLEILSFLKTAIHITGNPKFEKSCQQLAKENHYAENAIQAKKYGPFENSHSDDILTYFPYYMLSEYAREDEYWPLYRQSLERTWNVSRPDRMPVWNIIASIILQKDCDMHVALEELQDYPMDLINWTMKNSHRWDLHEDPLVDRSGDRQATKPISSAESGISRWNTNPRKFDTGANGTREESGTYFLLPYWMARYHGLFIEQKSTK